MVAAEGWGGRAPYSYSWDVLVDDGTGTGRGTFPFGTTRQAVLTVTDAAGCTAQATSAPIVVNPELTVSLSAPAVDQCTGAVIVVATASGGDGSYSHAFTLLADDGAGTASGTLAPGMHVESVIVTDGAGCTATAATPAFEVVAHVEAGVSSTTRYLGYPDRFEGEVTASASFGMPPYTYAWDLGDDGSFDGAGASLVFPMEAVQTITVALHVTDDLGCTAIERHDVVSGGCPVDTEISGLMVRKDGGGLLFGWQPSVHGCHGRYGLLQADTARPAAGGGTFPTDPAWTDVSAEDGDGSDQDEALLLADPRAGRTLYFLVRDGGTDGSWGPTGSYGNTGVTP